MNVHVSRVLRRRLLQAALVSLSGVSLSPSGVVSVVSSGAVTDGPRYGFTFFPGIHLGPEGVETQAYPLPHTISGKGPKI